MKNAALKASVFGLMTLLGACSSSHFAGSNNKAVNGSGNAIGKSPSPAGSFEPNIPGGSPGPANPGSSAGPDGSTNPGGNGDPTISNDPGSSPGPGELITPHDNASVRLFGDLTVSFGKCDEDMFVVVQQVIGTTGFGPELKQRAECPNDDRRNFTRTYTGVCTIGGETLIKLKLINDDHDKGDTVRGGEQFIKRTGGAGNSVSILADAERSCGFLGMFGSDCADDEEVTFTCPDSTSIRIEGVN